MEIEMFAMGSSGADADAAAVTIRNAISLLAAVSDPAAAKRVLDQIAPQLADVKRRQAEAEKAEAANAERLKGLVATEASHQARSAEFVAREVALGRRQQQIDVASTAIAEREAKVSAREVALSDAESMLTAREQALTARIAAFKASLSA